MITLGSKVRDRVTCGFDEPQLEVLAAPARTKVRATSNEARTTGGPRPEPAARR